MPSILDKLRELLSSSYSVSAERDNPANKKISLSPFYGYGQRLGVLRKRSLSSKKAQKTTKDLIIQGATSTHSEQEQIYPTKSFEQLLDNYCLDTHELLETAGQNAEIIKKINTDSEYQYIFRQRLNHWAHQDIRFYHFLESRISDSPASPGSPRPSHSSEKAPELESFKEIHPQESQITFSATLQKIFSVPTLQHLGLDIICSHMRVFTIFKHRNEVFAEKIVAALQQAKQGVVLGQLTAQTLITLSAGGFLGFNTSTITLKIEDIASYLTTTDSGKEVATFVTALLADSNEVKELLRLPQTQKTSSQYSSEPVNIPKVKHSQVSDTHKNETSRQKSSDLVDATTSSSYFSSFRKLLPSVNFFGEPPEDASSRVGHRKSLGILSQLFSQKNSANAFKPVPTTTEAQKPSDGVSTYTSLANVSQ